jgi:hypothetical protein
MADPSKNSDLVISYLTLRRAVGAIGMGLPFVLVTGSVVIRYWCPCSCSAPSAILQDSISDYYGTPLRNLFVGLLFAVALFMFSYKGYENDHVAGKLASAFAVLVALFPTTSPCRWIRSVHALSAASLFSVFAVFSWFLFTKTDQSTPRPEKLERNRVYRFCGAGIAACIVSIGLYSLLPDDTPLASLRPVFWLETLALELFGVSWATKGEVWLKD